MEEKYWLTPKDYLNIFKIFEKESPNEMNRRSFGAKMFIFLKQYGMYIEDNVFKLKPDMTSKKLNFDIYASSKKEEELFLIEKENGFKNLPSIEITSMFREAWKYKEYSSTKQLYKILIKNGFNIFKMIGSKEFGTGLNSRFTIAYVKALETNIYIPKTQEEHNNLIEITENLVQHKEKSLQSQATRLLIYLSLRDTLYDKKKVKLLLSTFLNNNITISNNSIERYKLLQEIWSKEDFSEEIKNFRNVDKFKNINHNESGFTKIDKNDLVNEKVIHYQLNINDISRFTHYHTNKVKNNFILVAEHIKKCLNNEYGDSSDVIFEYRNRFGKLSIMTKEEKIIELVDIMFSLTMENCKNKIEMSPDNIINMWKSSTFMIFLSRKLKESEKENTVKNKI